MFRFSPHLILALEIRFEEQAFRERIVCSHAIYKANPVMANSCASQISDLELFLKLITCSNV